MICKSNKLLLFNIAVHKLFSPSIAFTVSLPQVAVFFGGLSIKKDEEVLKRESPHVVVGTPGRILALSRNKSLNLRHIKHFILDECDKMLEQLGEQTVYETMAVFRMTLYWILCSTHTHFSLKAVVETIGIILLFHCCHMTFVLWNQK